MRDQGAPAASTQVTPRRRQRKVNNLLVAVVMGPLAKSGDATGYDISTRIVLVLLLEHARAMSAWKSPLKRSRQLNQGTKQESKSIQEWAAWRRPDTRETYAGNTREVQGVLGDERGQEDNGARR